MPHRSDDPLSGPSPKPLDMILLDATPRQLRALARYHEHQADVLYTAARAIERSRLHSDERGHIFQAHRRAFICTGAKVALLMRRGRSSAEALAEIHRRTGYETSVLRAALSAWRRQRRKMLVMGA